jgi:tetratricopeptide (TPR) repeat protein
MTPEPVPMPELSAKKAEIKPSVVAQTKAALQDPLDVFKRGLESPKSTSNTYSATFKGVQAGSTTKTEVIDFWGKPARSVPLDDDSTTLIYKVPPFRQVDVAITANTVTGVLVHLTKPINANKVAKELELDEIVAVPVPDEYGEVLGQVYPEHGILFSFVEDTEVARVSAILLEPVSSEMFRMRAQYDFDHNFKRSLADLAESVRIDPTDAESYWLRAEYLDTIGRTREGLKSAQKAIRLRPTNPSYRITRSRLFAKTNRLQHAVEELRAVIDEIEMTNEVAGYAHNLLGDFLAIGPNANHQEALKHHLKAVDYASKSVEDRRFAVRRMAKRVLVTAHLSISRDIALGNFQRQAEVVPKWLLRATEVADEFISDDQGDELLQMQIFRDTLASYSELQQGTFDAAIVTEEALRTGRDLIANAEDEYYQVTIQRILAETLLHASKIYRSRGKHDSALQFATNALALLDASSENWENTAHDNYLGAELQFMIGSIHAIRDQNHQEAVDWYAKARSGFVGSSFVTPLYSNRRHGEMYVSMGLSFWETGDREKAVKITQTGAELMKKGVESGSTRLEAMAIPYGNLAIMHDNLGHGDKSREYAKLIAKVDEVSKTIR